MQAYPARHAVPMNRDQHLFIARVGYGETLKHHSDLPAEVQGDGKRGYTFPDPSLRTEAKIVGQGEAILFGKQLLEILINPPYR